MEGSGSSLIFAINLAFFFEGPRDNTTRNLKDSWSSDRGLRHSNTLSNYSRKKKSLAMKTIKLVARWMYF